jgi:hypothetical protein
MRLCERKRDHGRTNTPTRTSEAAPGIGEAPSTRPSFLPSLHSLLYGITWRLGLNGSAYFPHGSGLRRWPLWAHAPPTISIDSPWTRAIYERLGLAKGIPDRAAPRLPVVYISLPSEVFLVPSLPRYLATSLPRYLATSLSRQQ